VSDIQITREAVEAAARRFLAQLGNKIGYSASFDRLTETEKTNALETAEAMLTAAAPLIVAADLDRFAAELKQRAEERDAIPDDDPDYDECEHGGDCHTDAAVATWLRAAWRAERRATELRAQS